MRVNRLAYCTLFVLYLTNLLNWFDRQVIYVLFPLVQAEWQLSDVQLGLLGTAFALLYPLMAIPLALLSDRWLRTKLIALCLGFWSLATVASGAATSYLMLLLGRAGVGIGEAGYGPSGLALISDYFPKGRR